MTTPAVETQSLTKTFGARRAVSGLTWQVPEGSLCGLLGPNGAGKSTTLKMLLGITHPSGGTARVLGRDARTDSVFIRRSAAFVPEDKIAYDHLTGAEFLRMYGSFFPEWSQEEADRLTREWRIPLDQKFRTLSRGTRSRMLLTAALSRRPRLLLLDEPTEGLDPSASEELLRRLTEWTADEGHTAILATHRLEEVERVCDRIALLAPGNLVLAGNLDDLRSRWKRIDAPGTAPEDEIRSWKQVRSVVRRRETLVITTQDDPGAVIERLHALCGTGAGIGVSGMNLREIYLAAVPFDGGNHDVAETLV